MEKVLFISLLLFLPINAFAGSFKNYVNEIQIYGDRVRVHTGGSYGTCGNADGWFGWPTSHDRHKDWLSLVLTAKASRSKVTMYDQQNSCNGMADAVLVEGVFLPKE